MCIRDRLYNFWVGGYDRLVYNVIWGGGVVQKLPFLRYIICARPHSIDINTTNWTKRQFTAVTVSLKSGFLSFFSLKNLWKPKIWTCGFLRFLKPISTALLYRETQRVRSSWWLLRYINLLTYLLIYMPHTALINMRNKFYTNLILRKADRQNNYTTPSDIKSLSRAFTGHRS